MQTMETLFNPPQWSLSELFHILTSSLPSLPSHLYLQIPPGVPGRSHQPVGSWWDSRHGKEELHEDGQLLFQTHKKTFLHLQLSSKIYTGWSSVFRFRCWVWPPECAWVTRWFVPQCALPMSQRHPHAVTAPLKQVHPPAHPHKCSFFHPKKKFAQSRTDSADKSFKTTKILCLGEVLRYRGDVEGRHPKTCSPSRTLHLWLKMTQDLVSGNGKTLWKKEKALAVFIPIGNKIVWYWGKLKTELEVTSLEFLIFSQETESRKESIWQ